MLKFISKCAGGFLTCQEASRLQSEAMDHPLAGHRRFRLKFHLLVCSWCRRYQRQLQFLRVAARKLATQEEPPNQPLPVDARERISRKLRDHSS